MDEDNEVIQFTGLIKLDSDIEIEVVDVLEGALKENLKTAIVIGEEEDGTLYIASSEGRLSKIYWLLALAQKEVLDTD